MSTEPKPESPAELAATIKELRRRRSGIVCGLLTAAECDKLDAEQDVLIDRLAALATIQASASASQEPVAWQERQTVARGQWSDWYECKGHPTTEPFSRTVDGITYEWRPLYTAATQARPASGEAKGELFLGLCLDEDDTLHATLMRKEANGDATVLLSDYVQIKKGRDYILAAAPTSTPSPGTGTKELE